MPIQIRHQKPFILSGLLDLYAGIWVAEQAMKAILSNIGFVLQMTGGLTILPIAASFVFKETSAIIALLITAIAFFALGFITYANFPFI